MATVALQRITKRFPGSTTPAVDALELSVADGEFFSLVGPSGCGKTTTLRLIAGFEKPTSGQILFDGQPVTHLPPRLRNVGLVFQNYAVFPTMTVLKNVLYGLEVRTIPRTEALRRAQRMIALVGLGGLEHRMPGQLSGGQLQRVALARALVIEPAFLLLDEPLSNLDAKLRVSIRKEIRKLQQELRITTIYVTHDQEEALSISDRVAVMNHGRVEQVGTPFEVYRAPAGPFVADFVGATSLVLGRLERIDRDAAWITLGESATGTHLRLPSRDISPPAEVWVSIRPEALSPATADDDGVDDNVFRGTVTYLEFLGPVARGELAVAGLDRPLLFEISSPGPSVTTAVGHHLRLRLDPDVVSYGPRPR